MGQASRRRVQQTSAFHATVLAAGDGAEKKWSGFSRETSLGISSRMSARRSGAPGGVAWNAPVAKSNHQLVVEVVARFSGGLLRYLRRRLRNSADARDIAQETYARLLRMDEVEAIRDPQAYLFRIAANLAYEHELAQRRERARLDEPPLIDDLERLTPMPLEEQADLAAHMARLNRAMARLSPKSRAALVLHRRDGLTYEEIAQRLDTSVHMVKKYIASGLEHCRARMGASGGMP
jgi:RNA polymerase sigma factor (sigma-70 family)